VSLSTELCKTASVLHKKAPAFIANLLISIALHLHTNCVTQIIEITEFIDHFLNQVFNSK